MHAISVKGLPQTEENWFSHVFHFLYYFFALLSVISSNFALHVSSSDALGLLVVHGRVSCSSA